MAYETTRTICCFLANCISLHIRSSRRDPNSSKPLEGLKVIDVGCGGGILSEVESFSLSIILSGLRPVFWNGTD